MAQTARDTVTRALRMLGVIVNGVVPTAVEATNGLMALNAMMHAWKGQAVDIGHIDLGLNDDIDLPDEHLNGCTALLAVELSTEYLAPVPPAVVAAATNGWSALQAAYIMDDESRDLRVEKGLRRLGANRRGYIYP